jgi:hypothetical protein
MPLRRMTAYWVVLAAAALTTLVAAAVAAALAVFSGQALPRAVTHDLSAASGTALAATGPVGGAAQLAQVTGALKTAIGGALPGIPFGFWQGSWSDPLGLVPRAAPARPAAVSAKDIPLLEAAALSDVRAYAVLVSGRWPAAPAPSAAGTPLQAALPASAAVLLHVSVGDRLTVRDKASNAIVRFTVTGLFAERQLAGTGASYWLVNSLPASGSSTESEFVTYGPLLVDPAAFHGALTPAQGTWAAQPDMTAFSGGDLNSFAASVSGLQDTLGNSTALNSVQLSTGLPGVLTGTAQNLAVARSLLVISALQLLVLTGAALLAVAALLTTQREGETALLSARGATRWQLIGLTAAEVIPLCGLAALAGAVAGGGLARLLGGSLYRAAGGGPGIPVGSAGTWLDAVAAAAVIAVIAVGAMLLPGARRAPGATRARRGRQAVIAGATRAGADVGLVVLAVLAGWQLRRYSAVSTGSNGLAAGIDPVLALAPALALAGGTVLTLRLLPAAARVADRLAARGRRLTAALAGWQFSRQPLRQGGAALLLVMAVATGTLALAQHASWTRSASDQAVHAAGADVRVDLAQPLAPGATTIITKTPGVRQAMAAAPTSDALPVPVLAIDAARAPDVALLRADQSPLPAASLFRTIAPPPDAGGTRLAGTPAAITLTAALGRAGSAGTVPAGTALTSATATLTVTDATGAAYQLALGALPADGRPHRLSASLGGRDVSYPLRLAQLTVDYLMPAKRPSPVTLTLSVPGAGLSGWTAAASSPEMSSLLSSGGAFGSSAQPSAGNLTATAAGASVTFGPGHGQAATNPGAVRPGPGVPVAAQLTLTAPHLGAAIVPAIVTRAFADSSGVSTGSEVQATVNGVQVPLRIAAVVTSFPTVSGGTVIVDLTTIESFIASRGGTPLPVTQWWLATGGGVPQGLTRAPPPGSDVVAADELAAAAAGDPLSAAPQQALLAMAAAAALLAVTGFWVSIAANVRQRRGENALLAALGVTRRSAAAQLFIEKLMLSVPSAALGLVLGAVVARLLVPAVTLTTTAQAPVPPPVTLFDPARALALAAIVAVVPALAAALVMIRRPDPAAELRAAEAA